MGGIIGGAPKPDTSALQAQQKENEKLRQQAETDKRNLAEELAGKRRSRTYGGSRTLLSESRLNPETGIDETLGSGPMV
jgi:hypothetical protein